MISSSEHRYHQNSSVPTQGFYYSKLFWYFKQKNSTVSFGIYIM